MNRLSAIHTLGYFVFLNASHRLSGINLSVLFLNLIGGFLTGILVNYFSDVLPASRKLTLPVCRECGQALTPRAYLFALRCPGCGLRKPTRFFVVLIGAVVASLLVQAYPLKGLGFWAALPLITFLGVILVIDIEYRLVLFETSLFGFALCLAYGLILNGIITTLLGALAGFLIMFLFFALGIVFAKVIGKIRRKKISEVAFGFGDVSFGTLLGLLAGWPLVYGAILLGFLSFGAFSMIYILVLLVTKRYSAFTRALPFTPYLIFGLLVILYL